MSATRARLPARPTPATATGRGLLPVPAIVHEVVRTCGRPLDLPTRRLMEAGFGRECGAGSLRAPAAGPHPACDFGAVRIHADQRAAASARAVNARAYTLGSHIVFGAGQYAPGTGRGRALLAHELAHTLQQGGQRRRLQRAPAGAGALPRPGSGAPLPYREATELAACLRIMGAASVDYCRQEVLHEAPTGVPAFSDQGLALIRELQKIIDGAVWKEIRKRVYPLESAAGIKRARDRKALLRPDLTGLGSLSALSDFAAEIHALQAKWPGLATPNDRVGEVGKVANAALARADVPEFLIIGKQVMEFKAFFSPRNWMFVLSADLVTNPALPDKDAAELANTTVHESRHAEQDFLAARFAAGVNNKDAAAIHAEHDIPVVIAAKAVAKKFDAKTDPATKALGQQMFQASVTDRSVNQAISNDDGLAELKKLRADAVKALLALEAGETVQTLAQAAAVRDALKAQIAEVERRYTLYRNIPYEADAHEVGDAAELAFQGWP